MSSSSESFARLSINSNSEYIDMSSDLDEDLNAEVNSPVAKKRKVVCMTNGSTCGPASTAYPAAPEGHVYQARS